MCNLPGPGLESKTCNPNCTPREDGGDKFEYIENHHINSLTLESSMQDGPPNIFNDSIDSPTTKTYSIVKENDGKILHLPIRYLFYLFPVFLL